MRKYMCIKELKIELLGINGFEYGFKSGVYETIPVGSMWELDSEIDCGYEGNHLESIDSSTNVAWIEIDDEDLEGCFEEV